LLQGENLGPDHSDRGKKHDGQEDGDPRPSEGG